MKTKRDDMMKRQAPRSAVAGWVKDYLASAHARGIHELMACKQYASDEIQAALRALLAAHEIEALAPVGAPPSESSRNGFHPATHFRLIRETDKAYHWQVHVSERAVPAFDWSRSAALVHNTEMHSHESDWLRVRLPVSA